jgi:endoglucanase
MAGRLTYGVHRLRSHAGGRRCRELQRFVSTAARPRSLCAALAALAMLWSAEARPECTSDTGLRAASLPHGYLHTNGSQIVDYAGKPVRIVSVGWNGMNVVNGHLDGLDGPFKGIDENLQQIRAAGFNTVRVSWTDASLRSPVDMATYRRLVQAAGPAVLRIIFDHHQNEGTASAGWACAGQQVNGLWFDQGPGTNGTNGCGDRGTVTASDFQRNSASFAANWAGNSTVIGFDLHNEPLTIKGNINWGQGGPTDIHAMCTNVGNAIQAVDPGALIICEGPMNYSGSFAGSGIAPEGDLTAVRRKSDVLGIPDKIVYSVHEYPSEISDVRIDSGSEYVLRMNHSWGYLISENIAPVWIGEMGSSMTNARAEAWADTLLAYMNGKAPGGHTLASGQPGVSGSWWLWGNLDDQKPNGYLLPDGRPRPRQAHVVHQMMTDACTGRESTSGTHSAGRQPKCADVDCPPSVPAR